MRSKFDEQLKKLNEEMMHMGSMIEESIQKAIEAFIHQDADSAKDIMEGDSEIDREQKKIESLCFNLLMQQQPVARDLRTISAAMKMVTDMERIGDMGLVGVELCQPIADALTCFISLPFLLAFLRQLEQMDKAEASHAPAQL